MLVEALTPLLEVVPGRPVIGRIRVVNDTERDTSYQIRVVGIDAPTEWRPVAGGAVAAGTEVHVEVPILVPDLLGTGQHPVGVEVTSDQRSERPGLAAFTVSVESVADVLLRVEPTIIRGATRGKFVLDIENREPTPVTLELVGGATDISVKFKPDEVRLLPGQRAVSKGKLKGRRRWSGDHEQHFVTLSARGRASSTSITTRFVQRSMFPWRLRRIVAVLVVLALWLAGAGAYVWYRNNKANDAADAAAAEQELLAEAEADASGDGGGDAAVDGAGGSGSEPGAGQGEATADAAAEAAAQFPTETTFGGSVTLADGADPAAVKVSLDEIPLGQAAEGAQPAGFLGDRDTAKIWSARYGSGDLPGVRSMRQTETVRSVDTTKDGTWKIGQVALRRNYEVVFSRSGYDTQSFVVTPTEDGAPVEIDVEMQPGIGVVAGVVRDSNGPIGGVKLVATDGDLSFATTSSTDSAKLGEFSFNGLSTPAVYTVTASRSGYGTEVVQFDLAAGQARAGEVISMRKGVGSITGTVIAKQQDATGGSTEQPLGGVTITVTNGDLVRTVTTLTEGATGTFSVPRLPIPATYTVTANAPGFSEASLTVELSGAQSDAVLRLINEFATLRGLVVDDNGLPVSGAGITLSHDDLSFSSNTVSDDNATGSIAAGFEQFLIGDGTARLREMTSFGAQPGEFGINDLPPGEYRVEIVHFAHEPYSATVVLEPGDDKYLSIPLETRKEVVGVKQSLSVFATENGERQLEGVEFWLRRPGQAHNKAIPGKIPPDGNKIVAFDDLEIGTYILRAELENYRTNEVLVQVGATVDEPAEIQLRPFGNVIVRVVDSVTDEEIDGYDLRIVEVRDDNLETQKINGQINPVDEQDLNGILWATPVTEDLSDGIWEVEIRDHPDGYRILAQDIVFPPPTVDPVTDSLRFQVTRDSRPTIEIKLTASAFPNIKVRTYAPPASPTLPQEVALSGFDGLTVELQCGPTVYATAIPDTTGPGVRTGIFDIPKELLASPNLLTEGCEIVARGDAYEPTTVPLNGLLRLASEGTTFDRQLSLVVLPRAVTITGRVSWFDGVEDVYLPDTEIRSTTIVTTGYEPRQTIGVAIPDKPTAITGFVDAVWNDDPDQPGVESERSFTISGQVFHTADYQVSYPDDIDSTLTPGTLRLAIPLVPGTSALTVPASASTTTALASQTQVAPAIFDYDAETNTFDYNVKLLDPLPGTLQGCLTVKTDRPAPRFDEILSQVTATPAWAPGDRFSVTYPADVAGCAVDESGDNIEPQTKGFEYGAPAGRWNVNYALPDGGLYQFEPDTEQPAEGLVEPARTRTGFDRTLVENGTIELTIVPGDAIGDAPQPALDTTYTVQPYASYPGPELDPVNVGDALSTTIRGVPVDAGAPFVQVDDALLLEIPGYDIANAKVTVGTAPEVAGAGEITVPIKAGEDVNVSVEIDPLGQISGSIQGYVWRLPDDRQLVAGFSSQTGIMVQARQVDYDESTLERLAPLDDSGWFDVPDPLVPNPTDNSIDFTLTNVQPGAYEFRVVATSDPVETAYKLGPLTSGVQLLDVEFPIPSPGKGAKLTDDSFVYAMRNTENNTISGPLALVLESSELTLRLWNSYSGNDSGIALAGAQMRVTRISGGAILPNGLPAPVGTLPDDPALVWDLPAAATTIRLQPDTYRFEIVHRPGPAFTDESYPSTIEITLPSGPTPAERSLRVDAILPSLNFQLAVHVKVVNQAGVPLDLTTPTSRNRLLVPDQVVVTRSWEAPSAFVTGDSTTQVTNQAVLGVPQTLKTCAPADTDPTCDNRAPGYVRTLVFDKIPTGRHTLAFSAPNGYVDYPVTYQIEVDGVSDEFDLVLKVDDVQVDVAITGADTDAFPNQQAALYYNDSLLGPTLVEEFGSDLDPRTTVTRSTENPRLVRITGLPPRREGYQLRIDDDLHAPNFGLAPPEGSPPVDFVAQIDLDEDPLTYQQLSTTVVADVGRLVASLRLEKTRDACPGPIDPAQCDVLPATGVFQVDTTRFPPYTNGLATVDFTGVDETHDIVVTNGVAYEEFEAPDVSVPRGQIKTLDVELRKLALINLDVTGADPGDVTIVPTILPEPAAPPEAAAPTLTRIDPPNDSRANRWKFYVSPETASIAFTVTAPGLFPFVVAPIDTYTGLVEPVLAALATRSVTVDVSSSDGGDFIPTIDIKVPESGTSTYTEQYVATSADDTFSVDFPVVNGPIPDEGQAEATVSAPGYRANKGATTGEITSNEHIAIQLHPLVTVTGQITVSGDIETGSTTVVTARRCSATELTAGSGECGLAPGGITHTATVSEDGSYTFPNGFDVGTWTVSASVIGWGAGVSPRFSITAASADEIEAPTFGLTPRAIKATLTVTRPNGDAVDPADWQAVGTGVSESGAVVSLFESGTMSPSFVIRERTSLRTPITLDLLTAAVNTVPNPDTVTISQSMTLYEAPVLAGSVRKANNDDPDNAVMTIFAGSCNVEVPGGSPSVTASGSTSLFSFAVTAFDTSLLPFDPTITNDYCLRADKGDRTGYLPFTLRVVGQDVVVAAGSQTLPTDLRKAYKIELGSPGLTVTKSNPALTNDADGSGDRSKDDVVTYTVTATNSGTISLTDVDVKDTKITPNTKNCSFLAPGATCVLIGTYTIKGGDVGNTIVNVASATSDQIAATNASVTTNVPQPALTLTQPQPQLLNDVDGSGDRSKDDILRFTITATNTGAANLTNVEVKGKLPSPDVTTTCGTVTPLAPGGTCTLTFDYTVQAGDVDSTLSSVGEATSDQVDATPVTTPVTIPKPNLTVTMPVPTRADLDGSNSLTPGDTLTFVITATNTGGTSGAKLTDVTVTAELREPSSGSLPVVSGTSPCTLRAPTQTCTLTVKYTVLASDIGNRIKVRAGATSVQVDASTLDVQSADTVVASPPPPAPPP